MASRNGKDEEFYIDHFHIFSIASVSIMANKAGIAFKIYRLKEPSDKFTIRLFIKNVIHKYTKYWRFNSRKKLL